jgi:hypothetical protein
MKGTNMKKRIGVFFTAIAIFAVFILVLTSTSQAVPLSGVQMQNVIGGQPARDCAELLAICAAVSGGSLWCLLVAGVCLIS